MADPVLLSCSRAVPFPAEPAFEGVLPVPLDVLFNRRYGPIPRIRGVEGQSGTWGEVGQTRTVLLAGGGSMREELTQVERPRVFGYTLTDVTGPMKPLVSHVHGRWSFDPVGTSTRITWQWALYPASAVGRLAMPVFGRLWRGYARQTLARIEELLRRSAA
jgi:hypothetical protein